MSKKTPALQTKTTFQLFTPDGKPLPPIATCVGKDTHLTGTLTFEDPVAICGSHEGAIKANGFLYIAEEAYVRGNIDAQIVVVCGTVEGDMVANELIELLAPSKVYGNLRSSRMRIADGCVLEGKCEMMDGTTDIDLFSSSPEKLLEQFKNSV